ncbi:MAG: rRNA methyltransferase [Micavibrio aeruginosavorus]|uniref:tRNA (cytidine/uridine-2'-O-)-methyltransferase TrmJ n=1 Tax=Micavibrio aeruginosavorus TaxID=349221 RepID=A0A2W5HGG1_9BACT|nr:MAG: rRNA methyltransferase [Micavibrio aeruginosavorus]
MTHSTPIFVLVEPQMGENIGACARAMLNCGFRDLRIVNPRDGWPNEKADAMSAGALELINPIQVYSTVQEAIADCHYIYATAADPRDMVKPLLTARKAASDMKQRIKDGQKVAVLFGRERTGLNNQEIALCHDHISIPLNQDFNSLNLGQAALLIAYEFYQLDDKEDYKLPTGKSFPAKAKDFNDLMERLELELESGRFFKSPEMKETMVRNIRNFLSRGVPTDQEVKTFHGVISALLGKNRK